MISRNRSQFCLEVSITLQTNALHTDPTYFPLHVCGIEDLTLYFFVGSDDKPPESEFFTCELQRYTWLEEKGWLSQDADKFLIQMRKTRSTFNKHFVFRSFLTRKGEIRSQILDADLKNAPVIDRFPYFLPAPL